MQEIDIIKLAAYYGGGGVLIAYFLWRDYKREGQVTAYQNHLQNYIQTTLMELVRQNQSLHTKSIDMLKAQRDAFYELIAYCRGNHNNE